MTIQELLDPQTFGGAVLTTVAGAGVAWMVGYLLIRFNRVYGRRVAVEGRFSTAALDDTVYVRRFDQWPRSNRIHEGTHTIVFGVMCRDQDLQITQINLRPLERNWYGGWVNIRKPWPLEMKKLECRQVEHERRGFGMQGLFNPWHDGKSGFDCLIRQDQFCLEKGTAIWFAIQVDAKADWSGAIGFRANVRNGPQLLCRRRLRVVGDHNALN